MQCPCCKKENPEHPKACALCGYDPAIPYEPPTSEASKAARLSFVLAILSFFTFLLTAIPAIIFACIALRRIKRSIDRLKGRRLAIAGIIVAVATLPIVPAGLYSLWRLDAPPIPNDYTIADLRSAPADCAESFELLMSISPSNVNGDKVSGIRPSKADVEILRKLSGILQEGNESKTVETVRENEEVIERAWRETEEARRIVGKLAQFAEIADLGELNGDFAPANALDSFAPLNLANLANLNQAYIHLRIIQGKTQIPVKELIELDSVIRRLAVNARFLLTKLICFACISKNIAMANTIANSPETSQESIRLLKDHLVPLTGETVSLRNPIVQEYLRFKAVISHELDNAGFMKSLALKRNSTLRLYRNCCDNQLAIEGDAESRRAPDLAVWPSAYRGLGPVPFRNRESLPFIYRCYNPTGSAIIMMAGLQLGTNFTNRPKIRTQDDLLQIVLKVRLGEPVDLKAPAYGGEYIVDVEGKKIFSPGPDGKAGTEDDISLPINPAVLGWDK